MELRLQHLRYFAALAEERSFTRAAEKVGITQPSLSEAIRELEAALQISLFNRTSRFVEVSSDGAALLPTACGAIDAIDRFRLQAATLAGQAAKKPLRIGAPLYSATPSLELEIIEKFSQHHPSSPPSVVRRTVVDLVDLLKSGGIDLAFILGPCTGSELSFIRIAFVPFVLLVPSVSGFARPSQTPSSALAGLHIASFERKGSPAIFDQLMAPLQAVGAVLDVVLESSIFGMRRHCEARGSGMLVPQELVQGLIADGQFSCLPIADLTLGLDLWLARSSGPQSRPAEQFWNLVHTDFAAR